MEILTSETDQSEPDTCAVATIGEFLLFLYQKSLSRVAQLKILRCLEDAGVCCCMTPDAIIRVLLVNISAQSPAVRNYTLKVLFRVLLEQCGGANQVQKSKGICHICKDEAWPSIADQAANHNLTSVVRQETSDSAFSGSDASLHEDRGAETKTSPPRWRVVKQLQVLVLEKHDVDVATQVMQHTLTIVGQGCDAIKQELFSCVFLPILQATRTETTSESGHELSVPAAVVQLCLAGLPLLLQCSEVHTMFLNYGGVRQLRELSQIDSLRASVLRTYQVLVILEERKAAADNVNDQPPSLLQSQQIQQTCELVKSDNHEAMDKAEEAIEAINLNLSHQTMTMQQQQQFRERKCHENAMLAILDEFSKMLIESSDHLKQHSTDNESPEQISKSIDIWSACNVLFAQSSQFRHQFLVQDGPQLAFGVLCASLDRLVMCQEVPGCVPDVRGPGATDPFTLWLTLMQASLDVCLAACRVQALYSAEDLTLARVLPQLRATLTSSALWWPARALAVKHVCDALLASASVRRAETDVVQLQTLMLTYLKDEDSIYDKELSELNDASSTKDSETCLTEQGYEGDSEYLPEETRGAVPRFHKFSREAGPPQMQGDPVAYPELCRLVVELLAAYHNRTADMDSPPSELDGSTLKLGQNHNETLKQPSQSDNSSKSSNNDDIALKLFDATSKATNTSGKSSTLPGITLNPPGAPLVPSGTPPVLPHCLLKVLSLVRQNVYTAVSLYNQGLLQVLLDGFRKMLTSKHPVLQVKQKLVLELFLAVAQHSISSSELQSFLQLFKSDGVCLDNLLPTALSLVRSYCTQPSYTICFPVVRTDFLTHYTISAHSVTSELLNASIRRLRPEASENPSLTIPSSGSTAAFQPENSSDQSETTCDLDTSPKPASPNMLSHHVPLQMDLKDETMWPSTPNHKGFSLSLWLRIEPSLVPEREVYNWSKREETTEKRGLWDILGSMGKQCALPDRLRTAMRKHMDSRHWSNQCLHLLSIGNSFLKFEVWTEPHVTNLIFRIVSHQNGSQTVLSEAAQATSMEANRWQHLALAFREESYGDRKLVTITTIIDGCFQRETLMEYTTPQAPPHRRDPDIGVGLGHFVPPEDLEVVGGRWQLGNLMLFRDCQMTKHTSFHIFALGPDCCTLSQCDCSEQTVAYSQFITDNIVRHSGLSHDVLTGNHTIYLQHLRENLVLSYNPHNATTYSLYTPSPLSSSPTGGSSGLKNLLLPAVTPKSTFNPLHHQPVIVQARLVTDLAPHVHRGLPMALDEIGGLPVFLFTFAKVVEMKSTAAQQAESLRLLFALMQNNPKYARDFHNMGGADLLVKVMVAYPCVIGHDILKVILDASVSQPVLLYSQSGQRYHLSPSTSALISDPQLLASLLLSWRVWERADHNIWGLGFDALNLLVRDDHPFQSFNVQQLQNAGVIDKILMICLERLQDALPALPISICSSMVTIISQLVGSPPDIHNIMSICDFLMLAHPAASTFVCHDDQDFYFKHKWVMQTLMDLNQLKVKETGSSDVRSAQDLVSDVVLTSTPVKAKQQTSEVPSLKEQTQIDTKPPVKEQPQKSASQPRKEKPKVLVDSSSEYSDSDEYDDSDDDSDDGSVEDSDSDDVQECNDATLKQTSADTSQTEQQTTGVRKDLFKLTKFKNMKGAELKSHSLPTSGFWSKYDNPPTNQATTSKHTNENLNKLIKKGITDAFKTLASSYPQTLNWNRMTPVSSAIDHPKEINIKEFQTERAGRYLTERQILDSQSSDRQSSGSEGNGPAVILNAKRRRNRLQKRSYSETETRRKARNSSSSLSADDGKENINAIKPDADGSMKRKPPNKCASAPSSMSTTSKKATAQSETNNNTSSNSSEKSFDTKYTSLGNMFPTDNEMETVPDENENIAPVIPAEPESNSQRLLSTSSSFFEVEEPPPTPKEDDWLVFSTDGGVPSHNSSSTIGGRRDAETEDGEQGLVYICANLLELLSRVLVKMSQEDFLRVTEAVLKPQNLVVMAHHSSAQVRAGVIKVLDIYLVRMTKDLEAAFLRLQCCHLLACQLHQHATTVDIAEACFTMLLGRPHRLDDDILPSMLSEMRDVQQMAVVPLIALLENSIVDIALCHNMLCLLGQVFTSAPSMVLPMMSNGLVEALCNTLCGLTALPASVTDLGEDERMLLVEGIQKFFCCIAEKCFSAGDATCFQLLEEMFQILYALEAKMTDLYGGESDQVMNIKTLQSMCFRTIFDYISELLEARSGSLRKSIIGGAVGGFLSKLPLPNTSSFSEEDEFLSSDDGLHLSPPHSSGWPPLGSPNLLSPPSKSPGGVRSRSLPGTNKESSSLRRRSFTLDPVRRPRVQSSLDLFTTGLFSSSSKKATQGLTQGELTDRLKKVVTMATDFVLFTVQHHSRKPRAVSRLESVIEVNLEIIPADTDFSRFLLEYLLQGIVIGLERSIFQRKTLGMSVMWQAKDVLRVQFARLVSFMISPDQPTTQRTFTLDLISNEPKLRDVLKITHNIKSSGPKLARYVYELQCVHLKDLSSTHRGQAVELTNVLDQLGIPTYRLGRKLSRSDRAVIHEDNQYWNVDFVKERTTWLRHNEDAKKKILSKLSPLSKQLVTQALEVTQTVTKAQNAQRKKFLEHVKRQMSHRVQVKKVWQQLIQQLTHERAVWHCPDSYPGSWQLDPTEGPNRVRRRLQRCHLGMEERFLTKDHRSKLAAEHVEPPLAYLFEDDNLISDSAALIYKLHTSQNIQYTCTCTHVTPSTETKGELLIGQNDVYFVADEAILDANFTAVLLGNKDLFLSLAQDDVKSVQKRWFQLRDDALEIFLTNGKTCLLAFNTTKEREALYQKLTSLELPNLILEENLTAIQQLWADGKMTNFEYLTRLNKLAGRSFNDLMQYPVFPFILASYDGDSLDLTDQKSFRNLAKPIAVQHDHRAQKYIDNYKILEAEQKRHSVTGIFEYHPQPYHYGSHYSNSGTVLHFLVRLPPFTQMFLDYQDRSFDLPDRTFHSLQTAWRLASLESSTDVKELIPEFFYLPEFLSNKEGYDFGCRQTGQRVWDVSLPPWCRDDARLFTLVHRQALESPAVSRHIHQWVDLVYGTKQQGKAAVDAVNVFHPATYFGVDVDSIEDPVRRRAVKTMIKTYGQTPRQLFSAPHPALAATSGTTERHRSGEKPSPLSTVRGLRWGSYVGSPDSSEPTLIWSQAHRAPIAHLVPLPTGGVFGLGQNSCLVVMYSKEKGLTNITTVDVLWAAIVSWGHPDSIIRIRNRKDMPAVNFLHWTTDERVTCCASVPDCRMLFFGGTSGVISVISTKYNQSKHTNLQVFGQRLSLYGHSGAITAFSVCSPYSVLVSASRDGTLIIWDLNRLTYVRSINDHRNPIYTVATSDTLGDIASVSHTDHGSLLMLHTVNAQHVSSLECEELVLCVTYSSAPEGRSVNVVAGGLSSGAIRLWSSWDLTPIRDIRSDKFTHPVISLAFTHDCQRLFAADADGNVAVWEKTSTQRPKDVIFVPFL